MCDEILECERRWCISVVCCCVMNALRPHTAQCHCSLSSWHNAIITISVRIAKAEKEHVMEMHLSCMSIHLKKDGAAALMSKTVCKAV